MLPEWARILGMTLGAVFTLLVLQQRHRHSSVAIAWILSFILLPFLAPLAYLLFSYRRAHFYRRRRRLRPQPGEVPHDARAIEDPALRRVSALSSTLAGLPPTTGNRLTWFEEGEETYAAILRAIADARDHVHLEYYIFRPDRTGARFRDALVEKAKEGVRCRLLVDHVGSLGLPGKFLRPFRDAGVEFLPFSRMNLGAPWLMQLRNHRKLAVIDGKTGFTGSQNIGDQYGKGADAKSPWKDSMIRIEGPGVAQLQSIFLEDWQYAGGRDPEADAAYFPRGWHPGHSTIQTLPTGPLEYDFALEKILLELVAACSSRILLMTPYFVPSNTVMLALEAASARGVLVDLVLPARSDLPLVDFAGRGWCRDLERPGIRIHVYSKTFLHSKAVTVDGKVALLGSANMDQRSFRTNFECGVLVYDPAFVSEIEASFERVIADSSPLSRKRGPSKFLNDVAEGAARLFSPVL